METPNINAGNKEAGKLAKNVNTSDNIRLERREHIKKFLLSIPKNNSTKEYDDSLKIEEIINEKIRLLKDSLNKMIHRLRKLDLSKSISRKQGTIHDNNFQNKILGEIIKALNPKHVGFALNNFFLSSETNGISTEELLIFLNDKKTALHNLERDNLQSLINYLDHFISELFEL